ncbi:MAG: Fe-S cluster assembly protein SufD [Kiritimatiellaceae bacterium]|nr:Fe-S cluster assembly protein SufD [Kiritimatiellaceae bacterium]
MIGYLKHLNDPAFAPFINLLPKALEAGDDMAREAAFLEFCEIGLGHRKVEAWKYTDVTKAIEGEFTWSPARQPVVHAPQGVVINPLDSTFFPNVGDDRPFAWLSRAFINGGCKVTVPAGLSLSEPIELVVDTSEELAMVCPSFEIEIGEGSRADILLRFENGGKSSFTSVIVRMHIASHASVSLTKIRTGEGAHFCCMNTWQAEGSSLQLFDATAGGSLTRNDVHAVLKGQGAEIDLHGFYATGGEEHVDNHTTIEHAVPHTASRQLYKGIMDERGVGVFNGRIVVAPGAFGTDAVQMNRNLLRSPTAKIDTKPQLEIGNDDVRCKHGATIGRLDKTALFYMESRGLERRAAEALLARGFLGEVIIQVRNEAIRSRLIELSETYFDRHAVEETL